MTLYERIAHHAQVQPAKNAIETDVGNISYAQLQVLIDQCIKYFQSVGLSRGDRIAILSFNHPDWFIAVFAAARCGIILVPMNWRLSTDELLFVLNDSQPKVLLHDQHFAGTAKTLQANNNALHLQQCGTHEFPPAVSSEEKIDKELNEQSVKQDELSQPLLIVYTSGTTGRPKGAVLSQQALMCSAEMSVHMHSMNTTDRILNVLPLFHVGGLNIQPLPALLSGATLVLPQGFEPQAALDSISKNNISLMTVVPTVIKAMMSCPNWHAADLSALKALAIGSTDVPIDIIKSVHERGVPMLQVYGATETSPVAIYQTLKNAHVEGSIGQAGKLCNIRLIDNRGNLAAVNQSGEIQVKGDNILNSYWQDEQSTNAAMVDGWFRTGDVAHVDSNGFYWFDDRLKHVIISGGENIYPAELERVISQVTGVGAVSVVGIPNDKWGEVPLAIIEKSQGAELDAQTIQQACSSIAKFKQPREILFIDQLPRNALGKIVVHEVKQLAISQLTEN